MDHAFFRVISVARFSALLATFSPVRTQTVSLDNALGRVLAEDIYAPENIPARDRSCMDGYAVRAADTFGASEGNPGYLELTGSLGIDDVTIQPLNPGECVGIVTGGSLPPGADAVVMVEQTQLLGANTVEVRKSLPPGENVMLRGEDATEGAAVLRGGQRLRPQDIGLLAALGQSRMRVFCLPRCAILSTGDELVPVEARPQAGQIRDVNSHTLACLVRQAGATPICFGLVPDTREALFAALSEALAVSDLVLVSGGSSIGLRDLTLEVLSALPQSEILAHGVSISPGKPTILARVGDKPVLGLPGQITSAHVVMQVFGQPLLAHLGGEDRAFDPGRRRLRTARLAMNIASKTGREDYVRVRLEEGEGGLVAVPRLGKSGLLRTMIESDGLLCLEASSEGMKAGQIVNVWVW